MKNILIVILLIATAALGAWDVVQHNRLRVETARVTSAEGRLATVETQLREKSEAIENAALSEQKAKILQDTLKQTSSASVEKSKQVEELQQSLASAKTNSMGNLLSGMFKDPKMREMIKSQQKLVMGPMIDKMYGAAFQQFNLTPEQTASLKDLLEKKMSAGSDMGVSMLDSDMDAAKRKELAAQVKQDTDGYDTQIKQLLGDDNYQAFQTYEKSASDRVVVGQFKDQLAGTSTPLNSAQEQQLIQAMTEERTGFKWTTDYSNQKPGDTDFAEMFAEDRMNKFAQEKEQFDQQFLARAKQILTPEQAVEFEKVQTAQRAMQINAMKLAGQMFGRKSQ
jgi:hypothetical protein